MKMFLAALALSAVSAPALAYDHCPDYTCYAAPVGTSEEYCVGAGYGDDSREARAGAVQSCEDWTGTACRVMKCEYEEKINVWGACVTPARWE